MKTKFLLALLVLALPLRAVEAPRPVPEIAAALKTVGGPTRHVAIKVSAHVAGGGHVPAQTAAARFATAGERADRVIGLSARAHNQGRSEPKLYDEALTLLAKDRIFLSHGRERTLRDIVEGNTERAAARENRRTRALRKAREIARALTGKAAPGEDLVPQDYYEIKNAARVLARLVLSDAASAAGRDPVVEEEAEGLARAAEEALRSPDSPQRHEALYQRASALARAYLKALSYDDGVDETLKESLRDRARISLGVLNKFR